MNIKSLTKTAVVAALYVVISLAINPLSFGTIQLRFADIFLLLCLYDKRYIYSNAIGVLIVNLFSPLGIIDAVVGVITQLVCGYTSYICKSKWLYSVICSIIVGFFVGSELYCVYGGAYWLMVVSLIISTVTVLFAGCVSLSTFFKAIKAGDKNV